VWAGGDGIGPTEESGDGLWEKSDSNFSRHIYISFTNHFEQIRLMKNIIEKEI